MSLLDDARQMAEDKRAQEAAERQQRKQDLEAIWKGAIISALEVLGIEAPRINYWHRIEPTTWALEEGIGGWKEPPPRFQVRVEDEGLIVRNDNPRYENQIELEEIDTGRKITVNLVYAKDEEGRDVRKHWTEQIARGWYDL